MKNKRALGYFFVFVFWIVTLSIFGQNSYVVLEAQYDSYGPAESEFYITGGTGDTGGTGGTNGTNGTSDFFS